MRPTAPFFYLIGLLLITGSAGCAKMQQPMTVSEFKGFCYQSSNGREKFCDNIGICDEYLTVLESEQPGQGQCLTACQEVLNAYVRNNPPDGCDRVSYDGLMWCQRYCRENYPAQIDAPASKAAQSDKPAQEGKPAS